MEVLLPLFIQVSRGNDDDTNLSLPDPVTPSFSTTSGSKASLDSSLPTPSSSCQTPIAPTPCPTSRNTLSPENPLVAAGLIPPHLRDILVCPEKDKVKKKKKTRVIIKS